MFLNYNSMVLDWRLMIFYNMSPRTHHNYCNKITVYALYTFHSKRILSCAAIFMRKEKLVWSCKYRLDFSKPGDEASKWILNHRNHQQKLGEKQHYKPKNILYHNSICHSNNNTDATWARLSRSKLKQTFLIDSDAELFMYLIQCIRLGS